MNDRNLDYPQPMQGYMAKQILAQVQADAHALEAQLRDNDRIPAWTLTKLATGGDRIGMAARYLLHKMQSPPAYGDAAAAAATVASVQEADKRASALRVAGLIAAALVATHLFGAVVSPRRAR
jgi:regulator of protease activity HflC (stomatin/prohibitin superfamily)